MGLAPVDGSAVAQQREQRAIDEHGMTVLVSAHRTHDWCARSPCNDRSPRESCCGATRAGTSTSVSSIALTPGRSMAFKPRRTDESWPVSIGLVDRRHAPATPLSTQPRGDGVGFVAQARPRRRRRRLRETSNDSSDERVAAGQRQQRLRSAHARGQAGGENDGGNHESRL